MKGDKNLIAIGSRTLNHGLGLLLSGQQVLIRLTGCFVK